ncbi:hypothetical protein EHQ19_08270 [Leptospira montravelensis]|uniref:hypothetical protein n=1 Tax=Leptospira montravelensis TaxID=2484961 RepID=UPI0010843B0B|nr:hypothetical protein [Leptospira montravelensis]TGK83006.1 hypothetical protein EHQ19_08270 [Leptospira montravelensis]
MTYDEFYSKFQGPNEGYCSLCDVYSKLTNDHVPPTSLGNKGKYLIYNLPDKSKSITALNGVKIKSVCYKCNNEILSEYDTELIYFAKAVKKFLTSERILLSPGKSHQVTINSNKIVKGIIGHLLAGSVNLQSLKTENKNSDKKENYFYKLRELYKKSEGNFIIECYINNYSTINIFPLVSIALKLGDPNSISFFSILSFYPLGFMIVENKSKKKILKNEYLNVKLENQVIDLKLLSRKTPHFPIDSPPKEGFILMNSYANIAAEKVGSLIL